MMVIEVITLSDEELVSRIQKGDRQSLDILVESYLPKVYTRVRTLVATEDVDDVVQEIFLSLLRSIDSFQEMGFGFPAWFNRLIVRRVTDHYRKEYRQRSRVSYINDCEEEVLEHEPYWEANSDIEIDAERLLASLPKEYREILLMKLHKGLSCSEIASILEMKYDATYARYRRALSFAAKRWQSNCKGNL